MRGRTQVQLSRGVAGDSRVACAEDSDFVVLRVERDAGQR